MESRPSRRRVLGGALAIGAGGLGVGGVLGRAVGTGDESAAPPAPPSGMTSGPAPVPATGEHQAGIAIPTTPQPFALTVVADLPDAADPAVLTKALPAVGTALLDLLADDSRPTDDLTITVGVGPDVIAAIDPALPGGQPLPAFAGDTDLSVDRTGGDLLLIASASDPSALTPAADLLLDVAGAAPRWRQFGFRGPGTDGIVRNPFGFHDGIVVPRGADELSRHVWLRDEPRTAGGTIAVVRRLRMDVGAFGRLDPAAQESVVGRRRADGAPLSGGDPRAEVDLMAKTTDGQYVTPTGSHARAAHPAMTGSALMLRRGYSYSDGDDVGLLFTSFQRDLRTFVVTQQRLDERDRMMDYVTATASAGFLVLPGFDRDRPLGTAVLTA